MLPAIKAQQERLPREKLPAAVVQQAPAWNNRTACGIHVEIVDYR